MSKAKRMWIIIGIVSVITAVIIVLLYTRNTDYSFVPLKAEYTDSDGNRAVYYAGVVGYKWLTPVVKNDTGSSENDSELYIETRSPDGARKYPRNQFDNVIANKAADFPLTLCFDSGSNAPDNVTLYTFGERFAPTEELYVENAESVFELGGRKRTYVIDNPSPETAYWVKACWGDEYLYYLIPFTDVDLSAVYSIGKIENQDYFYWNVMPVNYSRHKVTG